ncbi:MAG: transporter substrate-binding domain-containing protein [Alphaproteobacteria bacterium]|nr:transporter substrate-binding domain-containing protein [Alphaproteobacteria bacterium]
MRAKSIVGICLIVACVVSIVPLMRHALAKTEANGIIVDEEKEVVKERKRVVAECAYIRPMRVATFVSNPPFGWVERTTINGTEALVSYGAGVRIFEELAKKLGWRYIKTGYTSQTRAINALKRGELDLLIGVYTPNSLSTGTRGTLPVYPSFFQNVFTVYFVKDREFPVTSFESLEGKRGLIRHEENIYPLFSSHKTADMNLMQVNTAKKAFEMLLNDEADYLIGSPYSIEAELRRYKLHETIVSGDIVMLDANMFFVLTTNTDCFRLRDMLSSELSEYVKDQSHINDIIRTEIDNWGERFREDKELNVTEKTPDQEQDTAEVTN